MEDAGNTAVRLEVEPNKWRALALSMRGAALTLRGEDDRAEQNLAAVLSIQAVSPATRAYALANLGILRLRDGDLEGALTHARNAYTIVDNPAMRTYTPSVMTFALLARALAEDHQYREAAQAADEAEAMLSQASEAFWWLVAIARLLLAPSLATLGRREDAYRHLAEAQRLLSLHTDTGQLVAWHADAQNQVASIAPTAQPGAPLSSAEERVLRLLGTDLTLREIGRELHLSVNTVKTHTHAIYRKMNVSSRAEAVQKARIRARAMRSSRTAPEPTTARARRSTTRA
jgi:LuxR family maltose regulon positive regulatory protein